MKFGQYHNTSEDMDNTTPKNGKLWPQKQFWNIVKAKEYVLISKAHDITVKVLWGFKIHIGGMKHFCLNLKIKNTFFKKLGNKFDEHVPQFPRRCPTGLESVSRERSGDKLNGAGAAVSSRGIGAPSPMQRGSSSAVASSIMSLGPPLLNTWGCTYLHSRLSTVFGRQSNQHWQLATLKITQ